MQHKKTYLYSYFLICISFVSLSQNLAHKKNLIQLNSSKNNFEAGTTIKLRFYSLDKNIPTLYCSNNYGSTLVKSTSKSTTRLSYAIPAHMSNKSGILNWSLTSNSSAIQGTLEITAKTKVHSMETYLGNPSISAGGKNFTSIVTIPTDELDNPLKPGTPIIIKKHFLTNEIRTRIKTNKYIGHQKISSSNIAGRMLISSESFGTNSKEFTVDILPGNPTNFTITDKRNHHYADGNQIMSITTSVIKDRYGNIVSDGTYVNFLIRTKKQALLKTSGSTILGIATAQMVHPEQEAYWKIQAFVAGISQSNTIAVRYKQAITDFKIDFSNNNRTLKVGPLTSFMDQIIPDGLPVHLTLIHAKKEMEVVTKTSLDGFVSFELTKEVAQNSDYSFEVRAAGITKKYKQ